MPIEEYTRTYNSFSGVDVQATFAGKLIGELQGVSYTVTREKAPLYTMGSADPRSFSRGKRGIAGSLIFLVFDRTALIEALEENSYFLADQDEVTTNRRRRDPGNARLEPHIVVGQGAVSEPSPAQIEKAWYVDQIPPFDIVLTAANEYGHLARMEIRGVEILNNGSGISIDDITTDETMTYVARAIIPWRSRGYTDPRRGGLAVTP